MLLGIWWATLPISIAIPQGNKCRIWQDLICWHPWVFMVLPTSTLALTTSSSFNKGTPKYTSLASFLMPCIFTNLGMVVIARDLMGTSSHQRNHSSRQQVPFPLGTFIIVVTGVFMTSLCSTTSHYTRFSRIRTLPIEVHRVHSLSKHGSEPVVPQCS